MEELRGHGIDGWGVQEGGGDFSTVFTCCLECRDV